MPAVTKKIVTKTHNPSTGRTKITTTTTKTSVRVMNSKK